MRIGAFFRVCTDGKIQQGSKVKREIVKSIQEYRTGILQLYLVGWKNSRRVIVNINQ